MESKKTARFHLPGLFEFTELYRRFLPLFFEHRDWFYENVKIASIYGAPADCLFGGGRVGFGDADCKEVLALLETYGISGRLTFSNSLLREEHLRDGKCNALCRAFAESAVSCGVIVHSDLLLSYLQKTYPALYLVSSTTKVLTKFDDFRAELQKEAFSFVVADFRLNHQTEKLSALSQREKDKTEFLLNECCDFSCPDRRACYEDVSRKSLGEDSRHVCRFAKDGYRFSRAMANPGFISHEDIDGVYLPLGFSEFKIEGRSLGSAVVLEFLLYYLTKPAYHLSVRECIYLDSSLDLF